MSNFLGLFRNARNVETYPAGAVLFVPGTPATSMYVVRRGRLAIRVGDATIETVDEGGIVGEMALVGDGTRTATVVAEADCELVPVDKSQFLFLVQQTPFFALEVMHTMATRLRHMNERMDDHRR
jgi:CRP/FNR family cyclic AMP-dependent transcriptional regulator